MKTKNWLIYFGILATLFLLSCEKEITEKEDRLKIDIDAIEDIYPKTSGINIYKTCARGKEFSKNNLEVLLRGWNEVMEELNNPSTRSSLFKKNKNYLFTDGRYSIQSQVESGKNFKIYGFEKLRHCSLFKNLTLLVNLYFKAFFSAVKIAFLEISIPN